MTPRSLLIGFLAVVSCASGASAQSSYGDAGGGGSDFTYQLAGTAGVDLHEHYALLFGYRYLKVDYDKNNFLMDTALKGPLFGFTFKF